MKNKNIPQLRFPEFDGEWVEKRLGKIGEYIGGGTPDTSNEEYWQGDIPWVSSSDIYEDSIHKIQKTRFITPKAVEESATKIVPQGSILMVSRVGIGKFAIADEDLCTSQDFTNLVTDENEIFLGYFFKCKANRFVSLSQGTSIKGFTTKDIKSAKFNIPSHPEQTRIANFLTAVDKQINLLQEKKKELEQYKKGVMQKLFSREIRFQPNQTEIDEYVKIGKLKLVNGQWISQDDCPIIFDSQSSAFKYKDWEEKRLGEIGNFQTSSVDKLSKEDEEQVYLVNYMNVYRHENICNSNRENLQVVTAKKNQIQSSDLKKGDILFTPSSETPSDIGHSVVIFEDLENTLFSYHLMRYRPNVKLDLLYSHYFCNIPSVLRQLSSYATGSTRFTISVGNFSRVKVNLPSIDEQQKIANFLSAIDKKIETTNQQIESMQEWKKGLLQRMFV
ncbi:MAG: restriction endonuclease subunit S [Candidatus Cloacimonetes bacterium]|nr:restriction endonuclease subunit S [Candidatus Cloacimonadota bacterium]